jgi:F-type H+-transporting ATPase subunit a
VTILGTVLAAEEGGGGVAFPPISHLLEWKTLVGSGAFGINKIALTNFFAVAATILFFWAGSRKRALVPKGVQNLAEASIDFIEHGIIDEVMGHEGKKYLPFMAALFFYVFFNNITGVIPGWQMPATARMAVPAMLALVVWVVFIGSGIKSQGFGAYFKGSLFPPGVPKALYILVTPIEFISTFLVRPFSLAVRLFANVLAGHILLVTFAVLTNALVTAHTPVLKPVGILPLFMLIVMTGFEVGVALLQAYVFTLLTAVYIGGAVHPEH